MRAILDVVAIFVTVTRTFILTVFPPVDTTEETDINRFFSTFTIDSK
jgi:hypothetical protein